MAASTATAPLSPVAAPLGHRKRRHSQITADRIDLGSDSERNTNELFTASQPSGYNNSAIADPGASSDRSSPSSSQVDGVESPEDGRQSRIDGESDASLSSSVEDLLDNAEVNPYAPFLEGDRGLDPDDAARLRARLLDIGPQEFIRETLDEGNMEPRLLGTAFGIDPRASLIHDDDKFMRVLGLAIMRTFYKRRKLEQYNTIDDAATLLRNSRRIMVITGAGISTSLGIPDFRSKEGGFYTMLLKEGYDDPEAVFDIETFDWDPRLFYKLAGNILPDMKRFSPTHAFIRLLQDKGKLQRNYSQNIDALEQAAGIRDTLLVQCHGSFATATCRKNREHKLKGTEIFADIKAQRVAYCERCKRDLAIQAQERQKKSGLQRRRRNFDDDSDDSDTDDDIAPGVMKPDITFFGEQLPDTFFDLFTEQDVKDVDLVLVIGTSLKVAPVSEMPNHLPNAVPHIYISREPIEHVNFDIQLLGNCDDVVSELCHRAGWTLKHEMLPEGQRMRVTARGESTYRWAVTPRVPKDSLVSPRMAVPSPVRAASPAKRLAVSSLQPVSRTTSPARSTTPKPTVVTATAAGTAAPKVILSPSKPAFRPIPGSPARQPTATPPPVPSALSSSSLASSSKIQSPRPMSPSQVPKNNNNNNSNPVQRPKPTSTPPPQQPQSSLSSKDLLPIPTSSPVHQRIQRLTPTPPPPPNQRRTLIPGSPSRPPLPPTTHSGSIPSVSGPTGSRGHSGTNVTSSSAQKQASATNTADTVNSNPTTSTATGPVKAKMQQADK